MFLRKGALILLCIPSVVGAQIPKSAETFVRQIYTEYSQSELGPDDTGPKADRYFTPSLVRLIRRDQNTTPQGYVGKLDFDPLCACQDSDGLKLVNLKLTSVSPDKMIADVTLNFSNSPPSNNKKLRLALVKVAGDWRVDDVTEERSFDLRKILK